MKVVVALTDMKAGVRCTALAVLAGAVALGAAGAGAAGAGAVAARASAAAAGPAVVPVAIVAAAAALAGAAVATLAAGCGLVLWQSYRVSHPPRVASGRTPAEVGLAHEEFTVRAGGVPIRGWRVPAAAAGKPARGTVVLCHFLGGGKESLLRQIAFLAGGGWDVVAFDFRNHGQSGHDPWWRFRLDDDLRAVLDWVRPRAAGRPVALVGLSMGASAAALVAAGDPGVAALVLDSGPLVLSREYFFRLYGLTGLPRSRALRWLFMQSFLVGGGFGGLAGRVERALASLAPRPALFIHGERDQVIPRANSDRLFREFAREPKEYWRVPHSHHLTNYALDPEQYAARVRGFLDRYLPAKGEMG